MSKKIQDLNWISRNSRPCDHPESAAFAKRNLPYIFLSFFFFFFFSGGGEGFERKIKIAGWTFADRRGVQTILTLCIGLVELFKGNSRDLLGEKHRGFF